MPSQASVAQLETGGLGDRTGILAQPCAVVRSLGAGGMFEK
jgi:hypothetical protein